MDADDGAGAAHELEGPTPLARSLLWALQRASYQAQGPLAWRPGGVPLQVTSNPFIARAYANVIAGLVRDLRAAGALARPLRIVELGAGSGRFAFYLLEALTAAFARDGEQPWRLVMTDLTERNLAAWQAHPKLAPYFAGGRCDVARFDVAAPGPLALRVSGEVIDVDAGGEPVVAIANYVFDSVPAAAYRVEDGGLREWLVALEAPVARELALLDPAATIEALGWRAVPGARWAGDEPTLAAIAREGVEGSTVLWPAAALATLDFLAGVGGGRLLALTSDKGAREPALRLGRDDLGLVRHGGCVSLPVDFHALACAIEARGGWALPARQRHDRFYTGVLARGLDARALPRCLDAVDELERFGPGDYQRLVEHTAASAAAPSIEQVLTLLRLGDADPRLVTRFAEPLAAAVVAQRGDWLARDLIDVLARARALHFALPGQRDGVLVTVGTLLYQLGRPAEAAGALAASLDGSAADAPTHVKLALCWVRLGRADDAHAAVRRALALAPGLEEARRLETWLATGETPAG